VPPVPQRIALPGFGDGDDVEVGVFIGASLRERAIDDHRAHGGVRFRPRRGSLGHEFSGNGHQHFLSAGGWATVLLPVYCRPSRP
jgi:hypothetical protein